MKTATRIKVRRGQVYQSKRAAHVQVEIFGKSRDKWKARILTPKRGVYAGSHTFSDNSLRANFTLIE